MRFARPFASTAVTGMNAAADWHAPPRQALGTGALLIGAASLQMAGAVWAVAGGLALFVAGLPHGAFSHTGRALLNRKPYVIRYLLAGLLAGLAFLWQPVAALAAFLLASAWHFTFDHSSGATLRRSAIALIAIGGSALFRPTETQAVFAALCGSAIPAPVMIVLAVCGVAGYAMTARVLLKRPRDPALWLVAVSPALFHPVLATGLVFWVGHAGPLTSRLARLRNWTPVTWLALGGAAVAATAAIILALPLAPAFLPWYAAAAVGLIAPHLLPLRWLSPAADRQGTPVQSSQAAISPAT